MNINSSATLTIVAQANVNGVYTNIASVGSTTLDVNAANNSANVAIGVTSIPNADLGISLDASPDSAPVSSNFSFTITVTNRGPASAANVIITNILPSALSVVSVQPPAGAIVSQIGSVITCNLGTMNTNSSATLMIVAEANVDGVYTNTASVDSTTLDVNAANNSANVAITIIPISDLGISQNASPGSAPVSSNFTFTITATNRGPSSAANVIITNILPSALSVVSVQPPAGATVSQTGSEITCNLGTMNINSTATLTILAQANVDGVYTNTASVGSSSLDVNLANDSASVTINITPEPVSPVALNIVRSSGKVIISWPTNAAGLVLESRTNLSPSSVWTTVAESPVIVGNQYMVTNNVDGKANFYRLVR
jgi:uncharacterized repeat protein (TIGR01451 family)